MRVLIGYDGSSYADAAIADLQRAVSRAVMEREGSDLRVLVGLDRSRAADRVLRRGWPTRAAV